MLGRSTTPTAQIAAARAEMTVLCAAWRAISGRSEAKARTEAEAQVFNQMAVALEGWFVHRLRAVDGPGLQGADTNPLNEVRLLAKGVTSNGGYFPSDPAIRWRPEASVTGYRAGDQIRLSAAVFIHLTEAYLDAITAKLTEA